MVDIIGILGVIQIVIAYTLLQGGFLTPYSYIHSFLNLFGAIFILYSLCYNWNLSSFIIEVIWIIVSIIGIVIRFRRDKASKT